MGRYPVDGPLYEYLDGWKDEKCLEEGYKPLEEPPLGLDPTEAEFLEDKDGDEDDGGYDE